MDVKQYPVMKSQIDRWREKADERYKEKERLIFAEMKAETQLEKDIIHLKQMALDIRPYSNWWRWGYLGSLRRAIKLMEGKR